VKGLGNALLFFAIIDKFPKIFGVLLDGGLYFGNVTFEIRFGEFFAFNSQMRKT